MHTEASQNFVTLASSNWAADTCDKQMEGLLARLTNVRGKALESCLFEEAQSLERSVAAVQALVDLGLAHKRGYARTKKHSALLELVGPFRAVLENQDLRSMTWHWSWRVLYAQVEFQRALSEDDVVGWPS